MADTSEGAVLTALTRDGAALPPAETRSATFGMGCFWGPDARFGAMPGVVRTRVGYAGGTTADPSYYSLGDHTEVVRVEYDPAELSYEELLAVFWANHNPLSSPGKRQYRAVVLAGNGRQRATAERTRETIADRTEQSVATPVEDLDHFTLAEDCHQKYELRSTPVIGDELVDTYGPDVVDSTVAARLNGFVAGHGDDDQCRALLADLDLPPEALSEVERRL